MLKIAWHFGIQAIVWVLSGLLVGFLIHGNPDIQEGAFLVVATASENSVVKRNKRTHSGEQFNINFIAAFGHEGKGDGKFGGPFGIHVASNGHAYVAAMALR